MFPADINSHSFANINSSFAGKKNLSINDIAKQQFILTERGMGYRRSFDEELANSRIVIDALASIEGTKILSEYPRQHTLTRLDTTGSFDKVAQIHKKRGFFLSSALSKKGITGIIPGATKVWKINTYGMTRKQAEYVADTYLEIAETNGLNIL